ncbi:MAG: HhH-GPD superfamily base excision repair protein [Solirubrobacteraceae bacterium]|nr:HhH-GPD superfamily base excision repair protein [Solirubrobacteraceae bacterium]
MTAFGHLRAADPVLAELLAQHGEPEPRPPVGDAYTALVRAIVGQQLSVTAARTIYARLLEHFAGGAPTPEQILAADPEAMRAAAGLSRAKVAFLRSLAEHVETGELDLPHLASLPDEEIVAQLTAVKGVGVWTAHMFMIFELGRPDVLAVGDLGVRRGAERAYGLPDLPSAEELTAIAEPWRPHRSAACLLLWHSLANAPD